MVSFLAYLFIDLFEFMYLLILITPLFSFIITGLFGRKLGVNGTYFISCSFIIIESFFTFLSFLEVGFNDSPISIFISSWIDCEILFISWGFIFDTLTISIILPVVFISCIVHIFSIYYISSDPHNQRFFTYLAIFTFFIIILITGENFNIIFLGWEGIGVSSYLLINFWFTIIQANKSAIKAFVVNRVGDIFFIITIFIIFFIFGNLDIATISSISPIIPDNYISIITFFCIIAAMGKSAQIFINVWLPDAIIGPTPVSALIHAATLVTAGVYLLIRSSPIIEFGSSALIYISWTGAITSFFAASTSILQNDLKRVIAYSTCSQIGYLFICCGLSAYDISIFHLINHAFFKALLFLSAGSILHATFDQQDIRKLGILISFIPFTYFAILIGSISLIAIPFITGFYSKDLILEIAFAQFGFSSNYAFYIGTISACLTSFYSFRLITLTFFSYPNASKNIYSNIHDTEFLVVIILIILIFISVFFGFFAKDIYIGIGSDFLNSGIYIHPSHINLFDAETIPYFYKILPIILSVVGASLAIYFYIINPDSIIIIKIFCMKYYIFFNSKYYIDEIYHYYIINPVLHFGGFLFKIVDRGFIEFFGPQGITKIIFSASLTLSKLDIKNLYIYNLYLAISIIIFIFIIFFIYLIAHPDLLNLFTSFSPYSSIHWLNFVSTTI